jgi:hypothetical protein
MQVTEGRAGMILALRALKKNKIKQEKQEKTMMVLFCFWGFILFFIRPLAELCTCSTFCRLHSKNFLLSLHSSLRITYF